MATPRRLRLMAEHHVFPVWDKDRGALDPAALPLSEHLVQALWEWNDDYPRFGLEHGDPKTQEERKWTRRGQSLAIKLQEELGSGFEVSYQP